MNLLKKVLYKTSLGKRLWRITDVQQQRRRSKGGKSIMAIGSAAKRGTVSKIVPFLDEGAAVTTSRTDVDYIVTEYGIAALRGKSLRQRASALIKVAHPDFRAVLAEYVEPELAKHGGSLYLAEIRNNIAYVKFTGHCSGCPSAKYTIETIVKEEVLKHTDAVEDVRLIEEVSDELYEFAKALLQHKIEI